MAGKRKDNPKKAAASPELNVMPFIDILDVEHLPFGVRFIYRIRYP